MTRESVSADAYQESHLISPSAGWSRGAYLVLALLAGMLAFIIFTQYDGIVVQPLLGKVGYWFFQLMTGGIFILCLNSFLWGGSVQNSHGKELSFTWIGFFIRDVFMGAVFFPFAILIIRLLFSGEVKSSGLFDDLGGWEAFSDPATPFWDWVALGAICMILLFVALILLFIPVWMIYRALINLFVILHRGISQAVFNKATYSPGDTLVVKIKVARPGKSTEKRRVFLNYLQANPREYPPSSKKYKRSYLYTEFQDFSVAELQSGITFEIPNSLTNAALTSDHKGVSGKVRYWEILMEEPEKMHWARFFLLVE